MERDMISIGSEYGNDFIALIKEQFQYDNLFIQINGREQLKQELYHSEFINLLEQDLHRWYSVAEAGRVLGMGTEDNKPIPPSSLSYYIDHLEDYVIPKDAPSNRYIRLNYESVIKLKMILLLKDELRLGGIKAEVGITGTPVKSKGETENRVSALEEKVNQLSSINEALIRLLTETGEEGTLQLKKGLQSLVTQETMLLQEQSSIHEKLEEQQKAIKILEEEKKLLQKQLGDLKDSQESEKESLIKRIEENNQITNSLEDKISKEYIEKSEERFRALTEKQRAKEEAKEQAEQEWDQQGFFKRIGGNRSEYIKNRVAEILDQKSNWLKDI